MAGDDALDRESLSKAGNGLQVGARVTFKQERDGSFAHH